MKFQDLTGQIFGRLTVLYRDKTKSRTSWFCQCSCEKKTIKSVSSSNLKSGAIEGCGCIHIERTSVSSTKHGYSGNKFYNIWRDIKKRCNNKNHKSYKDYGGRGIKLYKEWENDLVQFIDYVSKLENANNNGYSIDRIDNDGNYEPGNVKWSTPEEQMRNTRATVLNPELILEMKKLKQYKSYQQISDIFNIPKSTIVAALSGVSWNNV